MDTNQYKKIDQEEEINLIELFHILRAKALQIVGVGITFPVLAYIISALVMSPIYESSAVLIVNNRKDSSESSITNDEITSAKNLAAVYNIIIKSNNVMEKVSYNLELGISPEQLAKKVTVSSVNNTQIIRVSVRDKDRQKAFRYTQEIVNVAPDVIVDLVGAGSVGIVSSPQLGTSPVSPNIKMNVLIALTLGVLISIGVVLIQHFLDRSYRTPEKVEEDLGLPIIGIIPNYEHAGKGMKS